MKKLVCCVLICTILLSMSACNANNSLELQQSANGNNKTGTTSNPFAGVWEYLLIDSREVKVFMVLNNDSTWFSIFEGFNNFEDDVEIVPGGTYQVISDNEFHVVEVAEDGDGIEYEL